MLNNQTTLDFLNQSFFFKYPIEAARKIENLTSSEAAKILSKQPVDILLAVWVNLTPSISAPILLKLPKNTAVSLLSALEPGVCAALLSRLEKKKRQYFLSILEEKIAEELREILSYPRDSVGRIMSSNVIAFRKSITVFDAIKLLKREKIPALHYVFLIDQDMKLCGQVDVQQLILADNNQLIESLSMPINLHAHVLDLKSEVIAKLEKSKINVLPIVDASDRLVGIIQTSFLLKEIKENIVTDMQTMVGASADERALSSSLLVVRKRLPWLHINLITAFMAASVVSLFEDTIATYTTLAILMPIAAGQSGNTGAQALAVTMRGLTLHEITSRHWFRVVKKEVCAGMVNGASVALTCGIAVYLWKRSIGLSIIIAIAMVTSAVIAVIAGTSVPIVLKRLGFDPAQSSTIFLTTITDISGFMSFLGTATLLSSFLDHH